MILSVLTAPAQIKYLDSLQQYQKQYKKDLFKIIKKDTGYVRFYAPDSTWRIVANVELLQNQPWFDMRTSSGTFKQARKYANVSFKIGDKFHRLTAYQLSSLVESKEYKDNFFIPFIDETSGEASYGGGRYLDFKTGDVVDNTLVVDFNKAYNPYCAFTTGYNCPIPPRENMLQATVQAGEKDFAKPKK